MAPQPFSTQMHKRGLAWGANTALERPKLAAMVAHAISIASEIDMALGTTLARMLGAEADVALAMYGSLQNPRAKRDAMLAAARVALTDEEFETFAAVQKRVQGAMDERNRFAHWIWAHDTERDDCVYFIDPKLRQEFEHSLLKILRTGEAQIGPFDGVLIYEEGDLQEVNDRLTAALSLVTKLHSVMLAEANARASGFRELASDLGTSPLSSGAVPSIRFVIRPTGDTADEPPEQ